MNWQSLSRRGFLKSALIATAAAGSGAALPGCSSTPGRDADGRPYLFLDPGEAALLQALGEAIVPRQAGFPDIHAAQVVRRADEELAMAGGAVQEDIRAALGVLQWAPPLYGHFSRYSRLDAASRRQVLQQMMRSRSEILRAVATNLKILIHFFYFGHRATWEAIGYDGPFGKLPPTASEQRQWYAQRTGDTGGEQA